MNRYNNDDKLTLGDKIAITLILLISSSFICYCIYLMFASVGVAK